MLEHRIDNNKLHRHKLTEPAETSAAAAAAEATAAAETTAAVCSHRQQYRLLWTRTCMGVDRLGHLPLVSRTQRTRCLKEDNDRVYGRHLRRKSITRPIEERESVGSCDEVWDLGTWIEGGYKTLIL